MAMDFLSFAAGFSLALSVFLLVARFAFVSVRRFTQKEQQLAAALEKAEVLAMGTQKLEERLHHTETEAHNAKQAAARLDAEKTGLEARFADMRSEIAIREKHAREAFENAANTILSKNMQVMRSESERNLHGVVDPLRDTIKDFRTALTYLQGQQIKESHALKEEISRMVALSRDMTMQTDTLAKALRGDVRVQGHWGEVVLERILEESGLRAKEDYVLQGAEMQLRDADGRLQKPDVIVKLPDGKHVIIDAKVSLVHYEQWIAAEQEQEKEDSQELFVKSVRAHIAGLEKRRYQDQEKLAAPDFVFMFMPIESAYSLAIKARPDLTTDAWQQRIAIVSPSTMFAALRTIGSLWKLERQNRNAADIARRGGLLYDKFAGFIEDMKKLGDQLDRAQSSYGGAMNKLKEGKGNLVTQAEKLREMGVQTQKHIPLPYSSEDVASGGEDVTSLAPDKPEQPEKP